MVCSLFSIDGDKPVCELKISDETRFMVLKECVMDDLGTFLYVTLNRLCTRMAMLCCHARRAASNVERSKHRTRRNKQNSNAYCWTDLTVSADKSNGQRRIVMASDDTF